jgi:uncharacterized protein (TIGR03067 family)
MKHSIPPVFVFIAVSCAAPLHAADNPPANAPAELRPPRKTVEVQKPLGLDKPVTFGAPEAADAAMLQGKWEGVEVGKETKGPCTLTVSGNSLHFQGSQREEWYKATFTLPPNTDPKQLVGTITECPVPEMVGKSSTGIYKIADGELTLAGTKPGSGQTPKSFDEDPATRRFVFRKTTGASK